MRCEMVTRNFTDSRRGIKSSMYCGSMYWDCLLNLDCDHRLFLRLNEESYFLKR